MAARCGTERKIPARDHSSDGDQLLAIEGKSIFDACGSSVKMRWNVNRGSVSKRSNHLHRIETIGLDFFPGFACRMTYLKTRAKIAST
jgi:hypothetical protein